MPTSSRGKFRTLVIELEGMIQAGKLQANDKMPSVRAIAEQYGVALATAARALEVLNGKGVIRAHDRSGVYLVADHSRSVYPSHHWAVCLRITPGPWQQGSLSVVREGFVDLGRTPGVHLLFDAIPSDLDLPEQTLKQLVRRIRQAGITGLFFLPSRINDTLMRQDERLLTVCRDQEMPVVLIERNLRGDARPLEWDLVCPDDFDGGYRCAMHLFETGRQKLAFVRGGPTSSHNDMMAGFLAAHVHARQRGLVPETPPFPLILEYLEGSASKDGYKSLSRQIRRSGVDGVVCYQDRIVIGLALELLAHGVAVPADVALTGFDDQPIGSEFSLGVTTYPFPSQSLAARAFQVMRARIEAPTAPPVKVLVSSRLIIRESSIGHRAG
jgi:LacI family transcriptional regulator